MLPLLILFVAGLIIAAFAAMAETALTSVSRLHVRSRAEAGDVRAKRLAALYEKPNAYLSTILTINTVAVIVASTSVTLLLLPYAKKFPEVLGTIVLSIFVLTFCEIVPKALALRFSERLAMSFARPVGFLTVVLRPIVGGLTAVGTLVVRVATRGNDVRGPFITEDQLKVLLDVGQQEGVVQEEERAMIHGILEMTDKSVRECMIPRIDVIGIESDKNVKDVIALIIEYGHSRIPIYEDTIDNIIGVVYAKDLLQHGIRSDTDISLKELSRKPYFTPESKHVGELLHEMQSRSVHIAIVVDEYGGTAGIITIEDVIEEIVGPIRDEYDTEEVEDVQFVSDTEVLVNPRMPVGELEEELAIHIGDVDADSIGGFVYASLGEIPKVGDIVTVGEATIHVDAVRRQSIQRLRITSPISLMKERAAHLEDELEGSHGEEHGEHHAVSPDGQHGNGRHNAEGTRTEEGAEEVSGHAPDAGEQ
ncbi:MAG: hemolysin family protein [Candidatus Dormibacteria bacterium]